MRRAWRRPSSRQLVGIALTVLVLVALAFAWRAWVAPTRVALVNFPDFSAARLIAAQPDRFARAEVLPLARLSDAGRYDLVLLFGRGLSLDEAQRNALTESGTAFHVEAATNPALALSTLAPDARERLSAYLRAGGSANYADLLRYVRHDIDRKQVFAPDAAPARPIPQDVFFHLEDSAIFTDIDATRRHVEARPGWQAGAPRVALLTSVPGPFNANRDHVDALIEALEKRGMAVYPVAANRQRLAFLQQIDPAAVVYMPHGRLAPGQAEAFVAWLEARNIPLFTPLSVFKERREWLADPRSYDGSLLTMSVTLPELDGGIAPMTVAAQARDSNGLRVFAPLPGQLDRFAERVRRGLALKQMSNAQKKLAIYYYKGPGQSALTAGGLEVMPSLYALLKQLRASGYRVDGLPDTEAAFAALVQARGPNLGAYARGDTARFVTEADPARVSATQLRDWCGVALPQVLCDDMRARHGAAPGSYLSHGDDVLVARVPFGNVVLLPQPLPGVGDDSFALVHGAKVAPPWPYLASYLWSREVFQADAIVHFGTHGSLEFTPSRQVALADTDWPDALIGDRPHVYLYTMSNVGEAMTAKRRSYATIVSHLTPPLREGGVPDGMERLNSLLAAWQGTDNAALRHEYAGDIGREARALGLHRELGLPGDATSVWTEAQLTRLAEHMEAVEDATITAGLYTLGTAYGDDDLARAARLIADPQARDHLRASTGREVEALLDALAGGYTAPSSGGDPLMNPAALPTGRNLTSIDAEKTPSEQAWRVARKLSDDLLARYRATHDGAWPRKLAITLWAGDFIGSEGVAVGQALYLLGVEPVRDATGRVANLRLIPREQLGRPRIDVVIQTSGQLRDLAASRLSLINRAAGMAAQADDADNRVSASALNIERTLKEQGLSPADAQRLAAVRVFGGVDGNYGAGIMDMVESGDRWERDEQVARTYINNMGATYGDGDLWAGNHPGLFQAALADTDAIVQPLDSNAWGPLSLDHVYEFMGGLNLAARQVTGRDPAAYFNDFRKPADVRVRDAVDAIATDARATLLNPAYIKPLIAGGASSADKFAETFRNVYGWNVMKPAAIQPGLWDALYDTYVKDTQGLGTDAFFERENPFALQEMTAVMLETARKGYWQPGEPVLRDLAARHAQLVAQFGASGTGFVNDNAALRGFIGERLETAPREAYQAAIRAGNQVAGAGATMTLRKEAVTSAASGAKPDEESTPRSDARAATDAVPRFVLDKRLLWAGLGVIVAALMMLIVFGWRRGHASQAAADRSPDARKEAR